MTALTQKNTYEVSKTKIGEQTTISGLFDLLKNIYVDILSSDGKN